MLVFLFKCFHPFKKSVFPLTLKAGVFLFFLCQKSQSLLIMIDYTKVNHPEVLIVFIGTVRKAPDGKVNA